MRKNVVFAALAFLGLAFHPAAGQDREKLESALARLRAAGPSFSRGLNEFAAGRRAAAAAAFRESLRKMPGHSYAHYYLANIAYIDRDYPLALDCMDKALGGFDFMRALGDFADRLSGRKIDNFQRMLETEWDNTLSCRTSREIESLYDQLSDDRRKKDLEAERRSGVQNRQKARYLYFAGNILYQLKRFPEASERYRQAVALNPRLADAYNNDAAISYAAGRPAEAAATIEAAEKMGLEDNLSLKLKHLVHEALGRPTEGILLEDLRAAPPSDLGVRRWALAIPAADGQGPALYENAYLVYSRGSLQAVLIDPGLDDPRIAAFVRERGLTVRAVLITHDHPDHSGAALLYAGLFGVPVYAPKDEAGRASSAGERRLEDGAVLEFGGLSLKAIHTPGHTRGSLCYLAGEFLLSGDTLFRGDIGKSWSDDPKEGRKVRDGLVRAIREKLLTLPGPTRVCPGHGRTSTIAAESADNPFLK